MGLLDKFKNLFSDEVEEDNKPIKKEVIQVEIASPKREEQKEKDPDITESEAIKKDEKFVFPVYFDDKDFDTLDYSKPKPKEPEPVAKPKTTYALNKPIPKEEKKIFKPSPIISPVYGVLDKNYSKDDITTKSNKRVEYYQSSKEMTIDDVRKKAFGTLEEELETELFSKNSILFNEELESESAEKDMFEELEEKDNDYETEIAIEEELTLEDLEEPKQEKIVNSTNMVENELNKMSEEGEENLSEGDLFNLIDSMYEKGDEK